MIKISSTRLGRFLACPRRARFSEDLPEEKPSKAMLYGTLFHACVEFYVERGRWPSRGDLWRMTGSYSDPREAVMAYPELWAEVGRYFDYAPLLEDLAEIRAKKTYIVEKPLADFGLTLAGGQVEATGFFDLLDLENRTIEDWKTRGDFRYAPITAEDFHDNVQLAYYAAALAQVHPDWPDVTVRHRNVRRPSEKSPSLGLVTYEATIDRWFLDAVWKRLDEEIAPAYLDALTREDIEPLGARPEACYMYGKRCPFASPCAKLDAPDAIGLDEHGRVSLLDMDF